MTELVTAWDLAEGDLLPGGVSVVSVQRNPLAGQVEYATDGGTRSTLRREALIVIERRALGTRCAGCAMKGPPPEWLPDVGRRVRRRREARGLSQAALGRAAGLHRRAVGKVELGRSGAMVETLWRIADALAVSIVDLVAEPGCSRLDRP